MITDFILSGLLALMQWLFSPLVGAADASLPASVSDSLATASSFLNGVAVANPTDTLYVVLGIVLAFELVIFLTKGTIFGIKKIPFIG